jgi:hypothetical protein
VMGARAAQAMEIKGSNGFNDRPDAVQQRKLQEVAGNSRLASKLMAFQKMASVIPKARPTTQLQSHNKLVGKAIQLVNRLTMHPEPLDTRLAGGGAGSSASTGAEVARVIASDNLEDLKDSHAALKKSIKLRQAALNPDPAHAARIVQEEGWLVQLDAAIRPLEADRLRRRQAMLMGPSPSVSGASGGGMPANSTWGGARTGTSATTTAPVPAVPAPVVPEAALTAPTPLTAQDLDTLYPEKTAGGQPFSIWGK